MRHYYFVIRGCGQAKRAFDLFLFWQVIFAVNTDHLKTVRRTDYYLASVQPVKLFRKSK